MGGVKQEFLKNVVFWWSVIVGGCIGDRVMR